MAKFRIIKSYGDRDPVVLGQVEAMAGSAGASVITQAWAAFQAAHPDTDSEFVDWLCKRSMFQPVTDDYIDVVV